MRKTLKTSIVFILCHLIFQSVLAADPNHLAHLRAKYPYGLLGDDYGILTLEDLALNACRAEPMPFESNEIWPYQYWQCFESKSVAMECRNVGFVQENGIAGRVTVRAKNSQHLNRFIEPRPWSIRDCKEFIRDLRKIVRGTTHVCISAAYIGDVENSPNGERIGILDRVKTLKGCEGQDCRLTRKVKHDFCPNQKS